MSAGWLLGGVVSLAILETVVTSSEATGRASGVFTIVASGIQRFLSPSIAAIPDLRKQKLPDAAAGPMMTGSTTLPPDWTTGAAGGQSIPLSVQQLMT